MAGGKLTHKQQVFANEYLKDYNATQAAIRSGYSERSAHVTGSRMLRNANVLEFLQANIMSQEEALLQITDIARGDMADYLDISSMAFQVDLNKAKEANKTKNIQKVKMRTTTTLNKDGVETETHDIEISLYDKLSALEKIGRFHKMFTDRVELSGTVFVEFGEDIEKL